MEDKSVKFGFIPTEGGDYYREFLEEAIYGEELGFDSVWLEEHHGVKNHYWPSPLMGLAGLATRTERILLGTDILVLPFYHPVRAAEDGAMLDIISNGRFIFGAAIGYKPDEFALYQTPLEKRGERFEEAIALIKQLWTHDEVTFLGKYYHVNGLKIEPRPNTKPHPKIWLGGWGNLSLARAARLGDAWVPGPTASLEKLLEAQHYYQDCLKEARIPVESVERPLTREMIIANSDERAFEIAENHLLVSYRDEYGTGQWQHPLIGNEDSTPVAKLEAINRDRFIIGSPETVIKQIQRFNDCFHMDHLICRLYFPGIPHDLIMEELTLLAHEVLPAFA
jgi:alkanesulfonate monooxygenase SsuD/methylene tetrahydromethanopterin reductase-like flavin-dependent oxidoreductase (luciferase family)